MTWPPIRDPELALRYKGKGDMDVWHLLRRKPGEVCGLLLRALAMYLGSLGRLAIFLLALRLGSKDLDTSQGCQQSARKECYNRPGHSAFFLRRF
jgi:hypothetical protein